MPNDITGLFETRVIPAGVAAAQALQYTKASLRAIYWDYKAEGGEIGQTMNVNIPVVNQGDAVDIGSGPLQTSDTDQVTVPIVLSHHVSASFVIKSWTRSARRSCCKSCIFSPSWKPCCGRRTAM